MPDNSRKSEKIAGDSMKCFSILCGARKCWATILNAAECNATQSKHARPSADGFCCKLSLSVVRLLTAALTGIPRHTENSEKSRQFQKIQKITGNSEKCRKFRKIQI